MAAAFGEGAAEASASGVASAGSRGEGAAFGVGADAVTSPPSVVIAVWKDDGDKAAVAIWALLGLVWLVFAEAVVDDVVVLVNTALHLGRAAAGEDGEGGCREEWGGDLG